jgi:lactate racemase
MDTKYYLNLGTDRKYYFALPPGWVATHFAESQGGGQTAPSVTQMTLEALARPVGAVPLSDMTLSCKRIAVIVDDVTRPTPVREILEVLLPQLTKRGASGDNVSIIVACGTHMPMERAALEARIGGGVLAAYKVIQHSAWQTDLVPVQIPGGVVKVNPVVAQADIKIGVSSILPHPMAGYGGGPKILMPGVCDIDSIMEHHMTNTVHEKSKPGVTRENPFHAECMRRALAIGLDLSINCVYDKQGQIVQVIAGSLEAAFAKAVQGCFEGLGVKFSEKVDITITSSHPHSHGIQFYKGLGAGDAITKADGAILIFGPSTSPIPEQFVDAFKRVREASGGDTAAYVTDIMSKGRPFLPNESAEFNMAMSSAIRRPAIRTILVSPIVSRETASTLGLEYAASIEDGLAALGVAYPQARVAIFPSGGLVIPITEWQ